MIAGFEKRDFCRGHDGKNRYFRKKTAENNEKIKKIKKIKKIFQKTIYFFGILLYNSKQGYYKSCFCEVIKYGKRSEKRKDGASRAGGVRY